MRRRVLVKILDIPPLLLGLSSLAQIHQLGVDIKTPLILAYAAFDLEWYSNE